MTVKIAIPGYAAVSIFAGSNVPGSSRLARLMIGRPSESRRWKIS